MKNLNRKNNGGLAGVLTYVTASMRSRKGTSFINIVVMAVAVTVLFVFAFMSIHQCRQAEAALNSASATQITAKCNVSDTKEDIESKKFTDNVLKEIREIPEVAVAYPCVNLSVYISFNGKEVFTWGEGIIPDDPLTSSAAMAKGRGLKDNSALEVVITSALFNELVGTNEYDLFKDHISAWVTRIKGSREEKWEHEYKIVGIINSSDKIIYFPLDHMKRMNLWVAHSLDDNTVEGSVESLADLPLDSGRVFVEDSRGSLEKAKDKMENHFRVEYTEAFRYDQPVIDKGGLRFLVFPQENKMRDFQYTLPFDAKRQAVKAITLGASVAKGEPSPVSICAFKGSVGLSGLIGDNLSEQLTSAKDFTGLITSGCLQKIAPGAKLPITVSLDSGVFAVNLEITGVIEDEHFENTHIWVTSENFGLIVGRVRTQPVSLFLTKSREMVSGIKFSSSFGSSQDNFSISENVVRMKPRTTIKNSSEGTYGYITDGDEYQALLSFRGFKEGVSGALPINAEEGDSLVEIREVCQVEGELDDDPKISVQVASADEINSLGVNWGKVFSELSLSEGLASKSFEKDSVIIDGRTISLRKVAPFPDNTVLVKSGIISKNEVKSKGTYISTTDCELDYTSGYLVSANDQDTYEKSLLLAESQQCTVHLLNLPKSKSVICFNIESKDDPESLRSILSSKYFAFLEQAPNMQVELKPTNLFLPASFIGSYKDDRLQNGEPFKLLAGKWLSGAKGEIVLPLASVPSDKVDSLSSIIGTKINFLCERKVKRSVTEPPIRFECEVVGIVSGEKGVMDLERVKQVQRWQYAKIDFNRENNEFFSPISNYLSSGSPSAKIFAKTAMDVEPLVTILERRFGYDTVNSLGQRKEYEEMVRGYILLVGLIFMCTIVGGIITVASTSLLNTKTKLYEIGILRSHGVSTTYILALFLLEGAIIGFVAFVVAMLMTPVFVDMVQSLYEATGQESSSLDSSLFFQSDMIWLHGLGFVISVFFCLGGVLISAIWACRVPVVKALSSRQ